MANCVQCGELIPDDQGSKTCSMCYGDIDHGKDGYYREWAEGLVEHEPELPTGWPDIDPDEPR